MHGQFKTLVAFLTLPHLALAQSGAPARALPLCESIDLEAKAARARMTNDDRQKSLETLHADMQKLYQIRRAQQNQEPLNFLNRCLQKKAEIYLAHREEASQELKASFDFKLVSGRIFQLSGTHDVAYRYFLEATRVKPQRYEPYWEAYQSWTFDQSEKIRKGLGKNYGQAEKKAFLDKSRELLDPVLKSPDASGDLKIAALQSRARFYDSIAYSREAFEDWKRLTQMKADDVEAWGRRAAFELEMKRWEEALSSLKVLIPLVPKNPRVRAQRAEALLELKRVDEAYIELRRALQEFPRHEGLSALLVKTLVLSNRGSEAEPYLALLSVSTDEDIQKVLRFYYGREGVRALQNQDFNRGLSYIEKSTKAEANAEILIAAARALAAYPPDKKAPYLRQWLSPLLDKNILTDADLEELIRAAKGTELATRTCTALQDQGFFFKQWEALSQCVDAFDQGGRRPQARQILERALKTPNFQPQRAQILARLNSLLAP